MAQCTITISGIGEHIVVSVIFDPPLPEQTDENFSDVPTPQLFGLYVADMLRKQLPDGEVEVHKTTDKLDS